jgi:hypothetical protein
VKTKTATRSRQRSDKSPTPRPLIAMDGALAERVFEVSRKSSLAVEVILNQCVEPRLRFLENKWSGARRTFIVQPNIARAMDGFCDRFHIPHDRFINHALANLCNSMEDPNILAGVLGETAEGGAR